MEFPKNSDAEVLMREINQIENTLAGLYKKGFCKHLIDPAMQVSERVQHLADIAELAANIVSKFQSNIPKSRSFEQEN